MICFVITWPQKTLRKLRGMAGVPDHRVWSYDALFRARRLPFATWVFTDFDRLGPWELELAAHAYRLLRHRGMRVLNDPALAVGRFSLLRRLHAAGLNRFTVWRPDELDAVDRWPVFLRTDTAHRGPLSGLIFNRPDLRAALDQAISQGYPVRDLMIVEYCAQPVRPDLFRKHAVFRIGDRLVRTLSVHDTGWVVKYGRSGSAGEALYREERDQIGQVPDDPVLHAAFALARLEYGRLDYAVVDGAIQVYEINSNPTIGRVLEHPSALRLESARVAEQGMVEALRAIDSPMGKAVRVADAVLRRQRRVDWLLVRSRWVV